MLSFITSIILSIAIALGAASTPSQDVSPTLTQGTTQEAAQGTSQPSTDPTCYEDMPCWDPANMGNGQGHLTSTVEADAWDTVDASGIVPTVPNQALQYVESLDYMPSSFPLGYFAIASNTQPQTFHVFTYYTLTYA